MLISGFRGSTFQYSVYKDEIMSTDTTQEVTAQHMTWLDNTDLKDLCSTLVLSDFQHLFCLITVVDSFAAFVRQGTDVFRVPKDSA